MAFLKIVASILFFILPAGSYACREDYDSPKLKLIIEPKFVLRQYTGNISVTCRVTPYRGGRLVPFSWLKVQRKRTYIKTVEKYQVEEGSYNLNLYLSKDDFGNDTVLLVTCQGVMLSDGCTNTSKVIKLLGRLPTKQRRDKGYNTITIYQAIGIAIGSLALVIGLLIGIKFWRMRLKVKDPSDVSGDPLTEYEPD